MNLEIDGIFFHGGSSRSQTARLSIHDPAAPDVRVDLEDGSHLDATIVGISDRIGAVDRQIDLDGGHLFSTPDNSSVDQLECLPRGFFSRVAFLETFSPRLISFLAVCILLIVGLVRYGLPVVAAGAAWATPPSVVKLMDTSSLSTVDQLFVGPTKLPKARQDNLTERFDELVKLTEPGPSYRLVFRDGLTIGPNAFALPAGSIVFTDQLIALGDDEELQAVMAHEIAHVQFNHGLKQVYRALGFSGLIILIGGDFTGAVDQILGGAGILLAMQSSREMELEADAEAVRLMKEARLNPQSLATMLEKLEATVCKANDVNCETTSWLSSHPGGIERQSALAKAIRTQR